MRSILTFLLLLALAGPALAVDGVLEINQACAVQTGCFAGDTAGFPVSITASGSYRLTGDLDLSAVSTATNAIRLTGIDDASIDFNGFSISGPNTCSGGKPVTCSFTSGGSGISAASSPGGSLRVFGGAIRDMAGSGISANTPNLNVDSMIVHDNGGFGVLCSSSRCKVTNSIIEGHAGGGIATSLTALSIITGNRIERTNQNGILAAQSIVSNNAVSSAVANGIECTGGCVVRNNLVQFNGGNGILVALSSLVESNESQNNGGAGIETGDGCLVKKNVSYSNTGAGLVLGVGTAYESNAINSNGSTVSGGVEMGFNVCDGNTTCP
jgi:hypothetical protein